MMLSLKIVRRATVATLVLGLFGGRVFAQEQGGGGGSRPPSRFVFGSQPERPGNRDRVDLNANLVGVYDDNVLGDHLPGGDPRVGEAGSYPMGSVNLSYLHNTRGMTLSASAGSGVRYTQQGGQTDRNHNAGVGVDFALGDRTRIRFDQSAAFATYYTLMGLPGGSLPEPGLAIPGEELLLPGEEFGVSADGGWEHHTSAAFTRRIGRSDSLDARVGFGRTDFGGQETRRRGAGITYRHTIGRQTALRAGYEYQTGSGLTAESGVAGQPIVFHNIDFGLEYERSLTRSRNTSVSFSTGSAVITRDAERDFTFLADARLLHHLGRDGTISLNYHRGLEYVGALAQLVASDGLVGTLTGVFSERMQASVSGSYSKAHLGSRTGEPLTSYSAVSQLQYAFSRRVAIDAQYIYYFYMFGADAARPPGVAPELNRQSVRGGISVWLPVLR
jgi:hypothetical protein